jgi:hypothetical protein
MFTNLGDKLSATRWNLVPYLFRLTKVIVWPYVDEQLNLIKFGEHLWERTGLPVEP